MSLRSTPSGARRPRALPGAAASAAAALAVAAAAGPTGGAAPAAATAFDAENALVVASGAFNRDLYALDLDLEGGGAPRGARLIATDGVSEGDPAWGPGRATVAYAAPRDEPPLAAVAAVWRLDAAAGVSAALSTGPDDRSPDPSPDGAEVAYASVLERGRDLQTSTLAVAAADGSSQRLLVEPLVAPDALVAWPRWSPDGAAVAFVVERGGEGELYRLDVAAGRAARWLARPGWDDVEPSWSPDGRWVAFASGHRAPGALAVEHGLWLFEPVSGAVGWLLAVPGVDLRRPSWSPDGRWLAYVATPRGASPRAHVTRLLGAAHGPPIWSEAVDGLDWSAPPAATPGAPPSQTPPAPTPTPAGGPTSTPGADPTQATEPPTPDATPTLGTLPTLAPLPPFPTLPPPEPTLEAAASPFPLPSTTPSPGPTATDAPTRSPAAARVFLPLAASRAGLVDP